MSRKMLRNVEKRGVHAPRNGPSLPPCVAKAEMSTAGRLEVEKGGVRAASNARHPLTSNLTPHAPRRSPLAAGRELGLISWSIPPSFVVSPNVPMSNTLAVWLCFGAFLSPPAPSLWIHWPLTTPLSPHASRPKPHATTCLLPPDQRGQTGRKPSPAGYSATDRRIAKTERDPISTSTPPMLLCHRTRRFLRTNQTVLPLPARRRPTVDHSLVAGGAQRHQFQACLPDGHQTQCLSFP